MSEIQLPNEAEDGVPPELLRALTRFVLVADAETAWQRLDGLELLMKEWDDLETVGEREGWISQHGVEALWAKPTDKGVLERSLMGDGAEVVPRELVEQLTASAVAAEDPERTIARESIRELLAGWAPLFDDQEKLLGHLLLGHGDSSGLVGRSHDELLELHTAAHSTEN